MKLSRMRNGGWVLRNDPNDQGLWFDSKEDALRWAKGMGITVTEEEK